MTTQFYKHQKKRAKRWQKLQGPYLAALVSGDVIISAKQHDGRQNFERDYDMLCLYYQCVAGEKYYSLKAIADIYNLTPERVRQLLRRMEEIVRFENKRWEEW